MKRAQTFAVVIDRIPGQRGGFASVEQAQEYARDKARQTKGGGAIRTDAGVSLYRVHYNGGPFESVEFIPTTPDGTPTN